MQHIYNESKRFDTCSEMKQLLKRPFKYLNIYHLYSFHFYDKNVFPNDIMQFPFLSAVSWKSYSCFTFCPLAILKNFRVSGLILSSFWNQDRSVWLFFIMDVRFPRHYLHSSAWTTVELELFPAQTFPSGALLMWILLHLLKHIRYMQDSI